MCRARSCHHPTSTNLNHHTCRSTVVIGTANETLHHTGSRHTMYLRTPCTTGMGGKYIHRQHKSAVSSLRKLSSGGLTATPTTTPHPIAHFSSHLRHSVAQPIQPERAPHVLGACLWPAKEDPHWRPNSRYYMVGDSREEGGFPIAKPYRFAEGCRSSMKGFPLTHKWTIFKAMRRRGWTRVGRVT